MAYIAQVLNICIPYFSGNAKIREVIITEMAKAIGLKFSM